MIARESPISTRSVIHHSAVENSKKEVEDFDYVSAHDLRRRYAQRLLVDNQMNPRVVMSVGGWDSFQAIEPYLNSPSENVVNRAFEEADL